MIGNVPLFRFLAQPVAMPRPHFGYIQQSELDELQRVGTSGALSHLPFSAEFDMRKPAAGMRLKQREDANFMRGYLISLHA